MMADKIPNEMVIPSCSKYEDQTDCETSTNKRSLYKSNALCERTSEQSLSDVIQKLTRQIEHIENISKCQNVTKNIKVNDISCDDELIYQPPNKIIKYDNDIISTNFCNSDENSIGIDCENNFNQKDLLDINEYVNEEIMSENENVTCKSNLEQKNKGTLKILTIEEEETLTKLFNNDDDEFGKVIDYKDKTSVSQTCEDYVNENISKKRKIQDDLLVGTTHVSDENACIISKRKSMSQNNYFSESNINKSDIFVNVGEILVPEMCDEYLDNSYLGKIIGQERKSYESTINIDNQETVCKTLNNQEENIFESSSTVDVLRDVNILEAVHPKIIDCENNFNQKDLLDIKEYVNEEIMSENENVTCKSNLEQKNKGTLKIPTIEEEETLTKLLNHEDEELGIVTDYKDKTTVSQTCEDYINESISKKRKIQDDLLVVTTHVSVDNACIISERKSMSQSNYFSESNINKSDIFVKDGEILVPEMCDEYLDNKDFGKMVVQERKSCESTINIDNQETVCETLNNQEEYIFESSSTVDGLRDANILEAVHPKIIDCENNFNQKDLLDINEYVNEEIMSENENVTCKSNLEQKNKGTLKILTIEEEETLTKLFNNDDDELGKVMDYKDKTSVSQTCEAYVNENISKKRKIQDDVLVVTTHVSDENYSMVNEGKRSYQTDKPTISMNYGVDITIFSNKEIDNLTERHFANDEVFVMPVEVTDNVNYNSLSPNCCCSVDDTAVDNIEVSINERNSQSSVTVDQFISSTFYFGTENCRDVSVHTIHSLDAYEMNNSLRNNTTVHSIENNDSLVSLNKDIENSIVELYCNSDNTTLSGIENKSYNNEQETARGIMKYTIEDISLESSNSFRLGLINDTSDKSISEDKFIESRRDNGKIPSDFDKPTMSQIVIENNAHKINDSVNISDQGDTNTSIELMLEKSMMDNDKIYSTEDRSMSQSNYFSESSINKSDVYLNVGEIIVPEMCDDNLDNSIDQNNVLDITQCDIDEIIVDHENCTSVTNEGINCTTDFGKMVVQERKSCESTINIDNQETVCKTLNNQEEYIFESSSTVDGLRDANILEAVHPKIIDCENNFNQKDLLDINEYVNEEIMSENENVTCKSNLEQKNKGTLKILTIEEEETLTQLFNNDDDELGKVIDYKDKTSVSQTCEAYVNENISKKRKIQDDVLVVTTHVSDENYSMVNEGKSMSQSNYFSESSINKSDVYLNVGEIIVPEMCDDNLDNSIDQNNVLDITQCDIDEIIVDHENCTSVTNEGINCTTDFGKMVVQERKSCESTINIDNQETVCKTLNNQEEYIFESSSTVDGLRDANILEAVHPKIIDCENNFNQKDLLDINEYVNEEIMSENENVTCKSNLEQKNKGTLKILTIEEEETLTQLFNNDDDELGKVIDYKDKTSVSQTCEAYVNENISKKRKIQDDVLVVTTHVSDENYSMVNEGKSMSQSNYFSESSINKSDVYLNVGEIIVPEMCDDNLDNSIDQNNVLDITQCDIDEIIVDHENCTSVTNEGINCTTDFGKMVVQERKSCESTINIDNQETVCKTLNNQEENIFESSSTVDGLRDVNILEAIHPKIIDCENNFNQKDLLDINEYVNEEIMSENENVTCKSNLEQKNKGTLKILTIEEEETLTKLFNNEEDELGEVIDYKDKISVSQTCEDYVNENISKKRKIQDDLLVVTTHVSVENYSMVNERKTSLSFNSSDARQILESSNDDSEHFDDSLLFKPSDRDLVRYGVECEAYEKSISQSLNNLENDVSYKEVIPQCNTPISINKLVSSSYVKDYEDNVIDFYDCELSSIENSDVEDNLLLSFVKDTSMDDCIFEKNQNKLKNATNSTSNEQTCDTNLKIPNLGSLSESCNNLTNVVSLIHSPSHDHQYNEIISTSISKTEMQKNPDADDKLESVNSNNTNTISSCNAISSFNDPDNINNIQSNNLCIDQGNFNEHQNLEDSIKSHNPNNKNKSISGSNTHQNIKKSQKSYGDNESETESSMKITGNCTIPKSNIEEIPKTNTVQSSSSVIDQSEIDKKKYLDEIIKNEQLFNKFDEKLDVNESVISPLISQSLAKSTNLKGALAKKAAAHINIHDMGDKALSTYLTQQTMTLDVLEVLHKSLDTCPSSSILMEDPEGLVVPLMPHQKHAIAWLIWRESQEPHGGILADDMGLGKTLSMISLILKSKEKKQDILLPVVSIDNGRNDVINGGTLVICPASLINQWETEVKTKLKPGLLKVVQYYGMNRNCSALELAKNDLVITSYKIVMFDQKKQQNTNPLCRIKWDRIILDEGHTIRNHKTLTSVAVCNIKSLNRWAITGTPIHNKEADFFTLLKFMRCKPFDDWAVWKRWVGNNDDAGKHRLSLLVKTLMLRRTKSELTQFTTFNLPKKEINTIEIELSKEERMAYENLLKFSSNLFATYLYDRVAKEKVFDPNIKVQCKVQYFQDQNQDKAEVFKDHPELLKLFKQFKNIDEVQTYHILVLLLRLRQICCHPILIKGPITEESIKKEDNMESILEDDTDVFNNDSDINNDTFPNNIDLSELMSCLTLEDEPVKKKPVIESNIFQKSWISTKIKKICDLVNEKVLIDGNGDKAIIVSQWPSFLLLIREHLAHYNAKMEMFSGAIPIPKRNKIIREFNEPRNGPQILLLSLKAGGVGLNLMAANHMFLVDIHWNPQLEAQACDRVYRVGQNKPVHVYKFICSNTIETRIMNIQTHKLQMADNLFKGTSIKSKITIDDLKQIFQFH